MLNKKVRINVLSPWAKYEEDRAKRVALWLLTQLQEKKIPVKAKKWQGKPLFLDIYLVSGARMKKNVLAFKADQNFPRPDIGGRYFLGEIYLNPIYIRRAKENFDFILIHGFLHLLGYDHKKKSDRIEMERQEEELVKQFKSL